MVGFVTQSDGCWNVLPVLVMEADMMVVFKKLFNKHLDMVG